MDVCFFLTHVKFGKFLGKSGASGQAAAYTEGLAASEVLPFEDGAGGYCPGVLLAVLDIERIGE